jgi:hypothetical protein
LSFWLIGLCRDNVEFFDALSSVIIDYVILKKKNTIRYTNNWQNRISAVLHKISLFEVLWIIVFGYFNVIYDEF